jgi:hypothetical protein
MFNKKTLVSALATVVVACSAFLSMNVGGKQDSLFAENVEALAEVEQPNVTFCIFSPDYHCEALHPTDPDKDMIRYYAKWW